MPKRFLLFLLFIFTVIPCLFMAKPALAAGENLRAIGISTNPGLWNYQLLAGQTISIMGNVQNIGSSNAGASSARLRVDFDNNSSWDLTPGNQAVGSITPSSSQSVSWGGINLPIGHHKSEICADIDNVLAETSEADNCTTLIFDVVSDDLIMINPSYDGQYWSADIKNIGTSYSVGTGCAWLFATQPDGQPGVSAMGSGGGSTCVRSGRLPGLAVNETQQMSWGQLRVPPSHPDWTFYWCADPNNEILETNESNNCSGGQTPPPPPTPPSCSVTPDNANLGQTVTWTAVPNGIGPYDYVWSGSDGLSGNSISVNKSYESSGVKTASVTVYNSAGVSGNANCSNSVTINPPPPTPTVDLKSFGMDGPLNANYGLVTNLSWTSTNTTRCVATMTTGSDAGWPGNKVLNGSQSTTSLTNTQYIYTLKCYNGPLDSDPNATDSITFNVGPVTPVIDQNLIPGCQGASPNFQVSWSNSPNATYYQIYRHNSIGDPGGTYLGVVFDPQNTYLDNNTAIIPGNRYYYNIVAGNTYGQSMSGNTNNFAAKYCPVLAVSCSASPSSAVTGQSVTWTAVPSGGSGGYTYSWSGTDSLSGSTISINKSYATTGTKTGSVTVNDSAGTGPVSVACSNSVTVGSTPPTCTFNRPTSLLVGQSGTFTYTGSGATTYSWTTSPSITPGFTSPVASSSSWSSNFAGTYVITLNVTGPGGANACNNSTDPGGGVVVSNPTPTPVPAPTCSFTGPGSLAVGNPGHYTVSTTGTIASYSWQTIAGPVSGTYSPSVIARDIDWSTNTTGSYTLRLTVTATDSQTGACQNTTPITVTNPTPTPTPTGPPLDITCFPSQATISINTSVNWNAIVTGGSGTYTYSWTGGPGPEDAISGGAVNTTINTDTVSKSYGSVGVKTATCTVSSPGFGSVTKAASTSVNVVNSLPHIKTQDGDVHSNTKIDAR